MQDQFGRKIEYMRISLTNNCNLRCSYCMPEKKIADIHFFPEEQVLRCVESAVSLDITHFRLTGGEPLCYPEIEKLVCKIKQIKEVASVHLTTNGKLLNVLEGIKKAAELKIPIKINAVLREQTDVCALAAFAEQNHVTLRFIEMMPIGFGKILPVDPKSKVLETLQRRYGEYKKIGCEKADSQRQRKTDKVNMADEVDGAGRKDTADDVPTEYGHGPAVYYQFSDLNISIGLIQAIHGKFCDRCNRIRITSEAKLKPCLASAKVIDLRPALEDTANPERLTELMRQAVFRKPKSHHFEEQNPEKSSESMNQIGG